MGSQQHHHDHDHVATVYDDDNDTEDDDLTLRHHAVEEDDVDLVDEEEDDSTTSSAVGEVTIAVAGLSAVPSASAVSATPVITPVSVSPLPRSRRIVPIDDSRRLFQRLWTDEDEIELLHGFLDYNNQRVINNPFHHHHHHDTTAFYDQIKDKLQLDFNKNQLVEKLRRLKKKYRNVVGKISSGKDYVFKTAHDQITFEISSKIWSNDATVVSTLARFDDEESNNPSLNLTFNLNEQNGNGNGNGISVAYPAYPNDSEKKNPPSRKRSRSGGVKVKIEEKVIQQQQSPPAVAVGSNSPNSIPHLVEETVKSCLLPLFKEILENSPNANAPRAGFRGLGFGLGLGGMNLDPFSLGFGGLMNLAFGDVNVSDEKWRKQHISELEVCSKRLELVQEQIKSQLEELRR